MGRDVNAEMSRAGEGDLGQKVRLGPRAEELVRKQPLNPFVRLETKPLGRLSVLPPKQELCLT